MDTDSINGSSWKLRVANKDIIKMLINQRPLLLQIHNRLSSHPCMKDVFMTFADLRSCAVAAVHLPVCDVEKIAVEDACLCSEQLWACARACSRGVLPSQRGTLLYTPVNNINQERGGHSENSLRALQ